MGKKRSKGVTIFAWFEIIIGMMSVFPFSFLVIVYSSGNYSVDRMGYGLLSNINEFITGVYLIIAGILTLKLNPKGRMMSILVLPIILIYTAYMGFVYHSYTFSFINLVWDALGVLIALLPLYFFAQPKVKEQFKRDMVPGTEEISGTH